jgi:hypothetical protein
VQHDLDARRLHARQRRDADDSRVAHLAAITRSGNRDTLPDEQLVTGRAGTVVVMNTHMWHAGTGNRTDRCRRALHGFYTRGDKPQQQFQKALLRPQTIETLSPAQRKVLALDDPENDRLSSETTRMSGFLKA